MSSSATPQPIVPSIAIPPLPDETDKRDWIYSWEWEERCEKWEVEDNSWPEWDKKISS